MSDSNLKKIRAAYYAAGLGQASRCLFNWAKHSFMCGTTA